MKKIASLIIGLLLSTCSFAQSPVSELEPMVQDVMLNGWSQSRHDAFWKKVREDIPESQIDDFMEFMKVTFVMGLEYQKEMWQLMKASYEKEEVIITPQLLAMEESLISRTAEMSGVPVGSDLYRQLRRQYEDKYTRNRKILKAAATHGVAVLDGEEELITLELIDVIIANIDKIFGQLQRLLEE